MSRYLLLMAMGLSVPVAGCKKQEPPKVTAKEVEKKAAEAAGTAADYAKQEKGEYVARAQKSVDEAKAEIDKLKARAKKVRAGAKAKLQRQGSEVEAGGAKAQRIEVGKWRGVEGPQVGCGQGRRGLEAA